MATPAKQRAGRPEPKRTQARTTTKKTASRPVAVPHDGHDGPQPVRITTTGPAPQADLVEIFSIDDVPYFIPREISPSVSLRYMKRVRQIGLEIAAGELLEELLGTEAYDALANCKYVTQQHLADVISLVQHQTMGAIELPKGLSRSA